MRSWLSRMLQERVMELLREKPIMMTIDMQLPPPTYQPVLDLLKEKPILVQLDMSLPANEYKTVLQRPPRIYDLDSNTVYSVEEEK